MIGTSTLIGIFLGAFAGGWLKDRFGRQVLCTVGLVAIYAFGPVILGALKLDGSLAGFGSALISVLFTLGTVAALFVVNRMGRRTLLTHSFIWSGVALLLLGLFPGAPAPVVMTLFSAYAVLIGATRSCSGSTPTSCSRPRCGGTAVGLASSLSRIGAAVGTYLVPMALSGWGIGKTMLAAAAISVAGAVASLAWAPETRGLTLRQSAALQDPAGPIRQPVAG